MSVMLAGRLSVLLPVRNEAHIVAHSIERLLPVLEGASLIVVDDASIDGTGDVVRGVAPHAEIVQGEGRGLAAALNRGLTAVRTRYVARMDVDDVSHAGRFRRQVELLERDRRLVACVTGAREVGPDGETRTVVPPSDLEQLVALLLCRNPLVHGTLAAPLEALQQVGGYDEDFSFAQDYELWLRLSCMGPIGVVPQVLYTRRRPTGKEYRQKRRRQARFSAHAQWRHFRRTGRLCWRGFARNLLSACWPGPRIER